MSAVWESRPLGDVVKVVNGGTPKSNVPEFWQGDIQWLTPKDMAKMDSDFIDETPRTITEDGLEKSSAKLVPPNSVIMSTRAPIGHLAINTVAMAFNQGCRGMIPCASLDTRYLFHFLKLRRNDLENLGAGVTFKELSGTVLKAFEIPFAPIEEQKAIAAALSDAEGLIESLKHLIDKKRDMKTAAMQQLLTGKKRLPGFKVSGKKKKTARAGYKQTDIGVIPEDWDAPYMGNLAQIQRGASPRPINNPMWFDNKSSIGWLRISDVSKSRKYLKETTQSLSEAGVANSRFVTEKSLVMSICATVGRPIITHKTLCIHDGFVVFDQMRADKEYMYYALSNIENDWAKYGQTGSQMNLNTGLINNTRIPLPSPKEQEAIAIVLSEMDAEIDALEQRLEKTRNLKTGMMQELLTGKTRLIKTDIKQEAA